MTNLLIAVFAYLIDKKFGEFTFIKHPIIRIGQMISFFEKNYYQDSVLRGFFLLIFMLGSIGILVSVLEFFLDALPYLLNLLLSSIIASIFVAHNMLKSSVQNVLDAQDKHEAISMLVSRDTKNMSESDIYKASIETYAENLSDGVVAPLFYLVFFGLFGIVLYKVVNTLDSMVGYRTARYENFGKASALLDDALNFIPSRITATLIMLCSEVTYKKYGLFGFYKDGVKHESPNAGHPITAAALVLGVKLGGNTSYFGKVKAKAHFGEGRSKIKKKDVQRVFTLLCYHKL